MDDEWDDLHGEPIDLGGGWCDATGDPVLDRMGYQSPRDTRNLTGFTPHPVDQTWLAQSRRDREQRRQRRRAALEQNKADTRQRVDERRAGRRQQSSPTPQPAGPHTAPAQDHPAREEIMRRSLTELQPGQHGAYFERREVRCWYAPWKKRYVWQQVSAWTHTTPPTSGTEVVTVGSLEELDGRVRTIGTAGENGTVVY